MNLGKAEIYPHKPIVAGSYATLTYTYTVGHCIDDSGFIKIAFRKMEDFGQPQFDNPKAANYCSISTTGNCKIFPRWDDAGNIRPYTKALYLQLRYGYLQEGEKIIIVFGDTSKGSPGWQMPTFCQDAFEFKTYVDPIATYNFKELPQSPSVRIIPDKPARAVCIAPSQAKVNQKFTYYLKLEDIWGNPTAKPKRFIHQGFKKPGIYTVEATDKKTRLSAQSNPIEVVADDKPLNRYWADFHAQSGETIGTNTIEDYFRFGRDYALLDILGHQGNDFQITDEFWTKINQTTKEFYQPGKFVTFPGFEWSGNTPLGGDRNVFFESEGGHITRSSCELIPNQKSKYHDSPTADDLFKNLKKSKGPRSFVFAHVGGRYANLEMHDPDIEVAVEVHSGWGTFEWLVNEAFKRGYRIGICANSDGHKARPGAEYPGGGKFGSLGGLTCVLAKRLDRKNIYEAMKARHFYATTGNRMLLDVKITTADGIEAIMGDVLQIGERKATLHVRIAGTAPIEAIEVRNGLNTIRTIRPSDLANIQSSEDEKQSRRIKIVFSGAEVPGRYRPASWDGQLIVKGNYIERFIPINFWNPRRQIRMVNPRQLTWQAITTGGLAGMILEMKNPNNGKIHIQTVQRNVDCEIRSVRFTPKTYKAGGLEKKIQIYRLPHQPGPTQIEFQVPLTRLKNADNPIYVCVKQEDGHMGWSSPIYLVR